MTDTAELKRLAEVIALRAEVARRTAEGLTMARNLTFLEGDLHKAEARATAAEADAERLAKCLSDVDPMERSHAADDALAVHAQHMNASKGTDQ